MKLFRNNACYVKYKDLKRCAIPLFLKLDKFVYDDNEIVVFLDQKSIDYIKSREDIVDYDDICLLTEKELDEKIKGIYNLIKVCVDKYLSKKNDIESISEDIDYPEKIRLYKSVFDELVHYKNNKKEIDENIPREINNYNNILIKK